jgi:hypothetical protein
MPHPNLVPFNFNESLITHSNGVVGSKSDKSRSAPLIDMFIVAIHPDFSQIRSLSRAGSLHACSGRVRTSVTARFGRSPDAAALIRF